MFSLFALSSTAMATERSNPWALPQVSTTESRQKKTGQPDRDKQQKSVTQPQKTWRFVTPEILDSLKRQQTQMQLMPGRTVPEQYRAKPSISCPAEPEQSPFRPQPMQGFMGEVIPGSGLTPRGSYFAGQQPVWPSRAPSGLSYGRSGTNPVYDAPIASPWGNGADMLYRGESLPDSFPGPTQGAFPWVPNEAVGGLLPIPVPSTGKDSYQRDYLDGPEIINRDAERKEENNAFNPSTFLPSDSLW